MTELRKRDWAPGDDARVRKTGERVTVEETHGFLVFVTSEDVPDHYRAFFYVELEEVLA